MSTTPVANSGAREFGERWTPVWVFLLGLLLRGWNYALVTLPIDDSSLHTPNAFNYTFRGFLAPDAWDTPPLKHLLLEPFIALLGYDPVGWRFRAVIFGAGCVTLTFLLARRAAGSYFAALAAALIVALDPLSIALSHASQEETTVTFFVLLGLLFCVRFDEGERYFELLGAGIAFGVAISFRQFALFPLLVAAAVLVVFPQRAHRSWLSVLAYLGAVPLAIYTAAYLPWMARGHTFADLALLHRDSYVFQSKPGFYSGLELWAGPHRWLVGFIRHGLWTPAADGKVTLSLLMTNPPLWWLFAPSAGWAAFTSWRSRRRGLLSVSVSFIVLCAAFILSPRPIGVYSAVVIVPLGAICLGAVLDTIPRRIAVAGLAVASAWCLYLFPVVAAIPVRFSAYSWLLEAVR